MKKNILITFVAISLMLINYSVKAQLTDGSYGENFTMKDYLGTTYDLYSYLDAGKPVILDVSATWCGPCWSFHQSGVLESYYNDYGPSGDNSSMVLWIEGYHDPVACLQGNTVACSSTKGDWTDGVTFPLILTVSPNDDQVLTDYDINYFPTIYLICPDRKVTEVGQQNATNLHNAALGCPALSTTSIDANIFGTPSLFGICGSYSPSPLVIQNYGSTTLTSCDVIIKIDGNAFDTLAWSGSLAKYEVDDVTLPQITGISSGTHTLTFELINPNDTTDENVANNTSTVNFSGAMPDTTMPLTEGFENATFPPAEWVVKSGHLGNTWDRTTEAGGFGNTSNSAYIPFYDISSGDIDDFYLLPVDLTGVASANLTFNVAYARYDVNSSDNLRVQVSKNCGMSWLTILNKSGATLATTTSFYTDPFVPEADQWRKETISLASYVGQSKVFIRFHATSDYGNNCYIDDINFSVDASIPEQDGQVSDVNVYPNPANGNTAIEFILQKPENVSMSVKNLLGQDVITFGEKKYQEGSHTEYFSTDKLEQGIYYINIIAGDQQYTHKIAIVK